MIAGIPHPLLLPPASLSRALPPVATDASLNPPCLQHPIPADRAHPTAQVRAKDGIATFESWGSVPSVYIANHSTMLPTVANTSVVLTGSCCKQQWSVAPTDASKADPIISHPFHVFSTLVLVALPCLAHPEPTPYTSHRVPLPGVAILVPACAPSLARSTRSHLSLGCPAFSARQTVLNSLSWLRLCPVRLPPTSASHPLR